MSEKASDSPLPRQRRQMAWLTVAAILIVVLVCLASALAGDSVRRAAERQALGRADLAVDAAAQQSLRMLETVDTLITEAQLAMRLRDSGEAVAAAAVEIELQRAIASSAIGVTDVRVVDRDNMLRWSSHPHFEVQRVAAPGLDPAQRDRLQLHATPLPGPPGADVPADARGTLCFGRVLADDAGAFRGFVIVTLDPMVLSARMARREFGPAGQARLVQLQQGMVVADSDPAPDLQTAPPHVDGVELAQLQGAAAGAALLRPAPGRPGRLIAFRRLLAPGELAVEVALDEATELGTANRQRTMIYAAAASFALICLGALIARALLLRRRAARATLAAAWRQVGAVKAVRAELEQLLVSLPVAAYQCRVGPDGQYVRRYVSPMMGHMTGWPMHALSDAAQWEDKLEGGSPARLAGFFASVLHDGEGLIEYRMRRPDGGWTWLRERARVVARVPDGSGEVIGIVADVTAEGELALQAAMTSKLAMLGELASGLAHELNQPMTVIGLAADRARDALDQAPADAAAACRALDTIAGQATRGGEIIEQLRLFGRGDAAPAGPVRLHAALSGAMILAEGPLRDARIALTLAVPETLAAVLGRRVQIEQVLVNLCLNARDALAARPEGCRRLTIAAEAEDDLVRLRISDTGGGIPPGVMARLFDPFVTSKPPGAGSGLGLSICKRLMRDMDGEIAARNTASGAVFTLTFRRAPQDVVVG